MPVSAKVLATISKTFSINSTTQFKEETQRLLFVFG